MASSRRRLAAQLKPSTLGHMRTLLASLCTLESQRVEHAREMFAVLSDPAIYEFENSPPESEARLAERFAKLESRCSADGSEQWLNWVVRVPSGELAGYVQATVQSAGRAYIAYELASRFWRQGIGGSAVSAMLEELLGQYQVHTFVAVLKSRNFRSVGLLRHLGFVPGGAEQTALAHPEADELVMYKVAGRHENAA